MSKNWKFFHLFIWGKISPENTSNDILQRKNAFLDYKNKNLIKSKKEYSFKGVGPRFWSKISNFCPLYISGKIGQEYAFHDILERKNAFSDYKNQKVKKDEKLEFFRRG